MRLTCPNCGAQYEVPDEVIPQDGRDVQCSNCGVTWFQAHPGLSQTVETPEPEPVSNLPEPAPAAAIEEAPDAVEAPVEEEAAPERRSLDPGVADILRQEAELEANLRASETAAPLETQTELGLDGAAPDAAAERKRARDHMAEVVGAEVPQPSSSSSRRDLLPDIEEINSTLRSDSENSALSRIVQEDSTPAAAKSGFARGFALVMIVAALVVFAYANAPTISQTVPQADAALNSLVDVIDKARVWLHAQVKGFVG